MNAGRSPLGPPLVLAAATIWGSAGLFVRALEGQGLSSSQIVYFANGLGFVALLAGLLVFSRPTLHVGRRALLGMLVLGAIGFGFSFSCYAGAITLLGLGLATLLTCTHPVWTTLLAWRFLGEPIRRRRVVAIVMALIGCALVVQVFDPDAFHANLAGSALGLAAGVTYAVYSTLGKHLLESNKPLQVTVYTLAGGTLFLLPIQSAPLPTVVPTAAWTALGLFVLGQVLLAPLVFNLGLKRLEAGTASILSTWEVVVAVLIGVLVLHETMEPLQAVGAALVGGSIVLLQLPGWRRSAPSAEAATAPVP